MSDLFIRLATRDSNALAGWRAGQPVTHGEWLARVRAWAGLGHRFAATQVGLYIEDSLEFGAALMGAWLSGKSVWMPADTLPATCATLEFEVPEFWGDFPGSCAPSWPAPGDDGDLDWTTLGPGYPAMVVYTSGSTGAPTPIHKVLSQLTGEIEALDAQFGAGLGDADVLATVSHQHIYGLLFRVLWPLMAGRAIHAERHEYPETLARALAERPCLLLGSPAHLKRLPEHLDWQGARAQLRAVFSSGGMLEAQASVHACTLLGQSPIEVYGSSETGGIGWRQRGLREDEGWSPLPFVQWRAGDDGLLEVDSVQAGPGGWQTLSDRVETLADGRFLLRGRADRIVKIEEKRVSLDAVEAALRATGLVLEARVLACVDNAAARQSLAAFVVLNGEGAALLAAAGKQALNNKLRTLLASSVEAVALPRRWRYLDRLPVNAQGKTTQALLLALLEPAPDSRPRRPSLRVLEQAPSRALLELVVPSDLLYFDGHFSVAPVLPGVVQVDWAIAYGREYLDLQGAFAGINALKFQQMIRPGHPVQLELVHDTNKNSLNFRYFSDAGAHASGRILLGT